MAVTARRLGPYAPLSATYASDDALIEAGEKAELLFVRILAFLSTSNSDGYFTDNQLTRYIGVGMRDATARASRLVAVGKLERTEGGYVLRSWLKWNKSAEELGREKKKDRERKAKESTPTPPPDGTGIQTDSERNPDGVQTDSEPHVRGGAEAHEAGALPNHLTSLHSTPRNATARGLELWNEHLTAIDRPLSKDTKTDLSRAIEGCIGEGFSDEDIRGGLGILRRSNGRLGPVLLPRLVDQAIGERPRRRTESERMFG